jgi:PAS domain S-box-containing protein/putative nucleotidyltransferase with HDIG domain
MKNLKLEHLEIFLSIFGNLIPGMIFVHKGGNFLYVNPSYEEALGYSREEFLNMPFWEIVHPEHREMVKEHAFKRLKGEKVPERYEIKLLGKGGVEKWFDINVKLVKLEDEPIIVATALDVSERKKIEKEKEEAISRLKSLLKEMVEAFSLAIEFRDPYTMGHQKRVAELSVAISEELGLDPEKKEGVRVAALLHDLGKAVGVPLEILNKPAKLNDLEFSFVKAHPEIGWRILKGVDFPWPVAEAVYQHHERLNGSGYPRGLKGDQIIIEARIIGVADVVEAMTSHRPYRPALALEEALREIKENKGILYDPQVVDAALKVFEKGFSFERI